MSKNDKVPSLKNVKHIILVLSGKGGVGKSSVTTQLALSLAHSGCKIGVLDIDLTGPSIPRMFGLESSLVHQSSKGWIPVYMNNPGNEGDKKNSIALMSIAFLLRSRNDSVVWRGPKKTAMIRQLINDVAWGELDFLLIDTPPGTSDEHIAIMENLKDIHPDGAVLVTTPQQVATADVRKELNFCTKVQLPILGIIENMSGYVCPHCSECTNIFSSGGGQDLAKQFNITFLGKVPIDPSFVLLIENQNKNLIDSKENASEKHSLIELYSQTNLSSIFKGITDKILHEIKFTSIKEINGNKIQ